MVRFYYRPNDKEEEVSVSILPNEYATDRGIEFSLPICQFDRPRITFFSKSDPSRQVELVLPNGTMTRKQEEDTPPKWRRPKMPDPLGEGMEAPKSLPIPDLTDVGNLKVQLEKLLSTEECSKKSEEELKSHVHQLTQRNEEVKKLVDSLSIKVTAFMDGAQKQGEKLTTDLNKLRDQVKRTNKKIDKMDWDDDVSISTRDTCGIPSYTEPSEDRAFFDMMAKIEKLPFSERHAAYKKAGLDGNGRKVYEDGSCLGIHIPYDQ